MKLLHNYTVFFSILFLLISGGGAGYYFLTNSNNKELNKQNKIHDLYFQIIDLELNNIKKDFKTLELFNNDHVLTKLQLAKKNEKKLKILLLDSLDSDSFYEKYKPYNDCVNLLYNTSKYESIKLKNKLFEIDQNILTIKQNDITEKLLEEKTNLYIEVIGQTSFSILETTKELQNLCSNFDSLNHIINSYIK